MWPKETGHTGRHSSKDLASYSPRSLFDRSVFWGLWADGDLAAAGPTSSLTGIAGETVKAKLRAYK
jgi:hypothetical protein